MLRRIASLVFVVARPAASGSSKRSTWRPSGSRQLAAGTHRRAGGERDDREALERARRLAEEFDVDAVAAAPRAGRTETRSTSPASRRSRIASSEPRLPQRRRSPPCRNRRLTSASSQRGLIGAAHEMKAAVHLREWRDAGDGRHLPVAEVAGQHQHALAALERADERLDVLDAHQRGFCAADSQRNSEELDAEAPQVRVVRLRERGRSRLRATVGAEYAAQVVEDHTRGETAAGGNSSDPPAALRLAPASRARRPTRSCDRASATPRSPRAGGGRAALRACALQTICGAP